MQYLTKLYMIIWVSYLFDGLFMIDWNIYRFNLAILFNVLIPAIKKLIMVCGNNLLEVRHTPSPKIIWLIRWIRPNSSVSLITNLMCSKKLLGILYCSSSNMDLFEVLFGYILILKSLIIGSWFNEGYTFN